MPYERGVRFLDTADLYDNLSRISGWRLRSAPDYVISTKAYCYDRKDRPGGVGARVIAGLGRDYVDLFMLHEQESLYTLRGHEEALNYLARAAGTRVTSARWA